MRHSDFVRARTMAALVDVQLMERVVLEIVTQVALFLVVHTVVG